MHLSAQYLCDLENHLKTALQYGLLMGVHRHDIFFLHMQLELQNHLCSWCYLKYHFSSGMSVYLWSCLISLAFLLLFSWFGFVFQEDPMPTSVLHGSSSNMAFSALSADCGPRQAAADPSSPVAFHPLPWPCHFNFSLVVWGQSLYWDN